eukprot:5710310-Prymnesium_polylepis.1
MQHQHACRTYVIRVWAPCHAHAFAQEPQEVHLFFGVNGSFNIRTRCGVAGEWDTAGARCEGLPE